MRGISNRLARCGGLALLVLLAVAPDGLSAEQTGVALRRVNAPYFAGDIQFNQSAVFWFGRVTPTTNYADVRVGYNDQKLWVHTQVFDRRLWYDVAQASGPLDAWDAVTLLIGTDGGGTSLTSRDYRFTGQLTWWEQARGPWQAAWSGSPSGWQPSGIPFGTVSNWRGDEPNNNVNDGGWSMAFEIPFASLGIAGNPPAGTVWRLAVIVHDRDDAAGTAIPDQVWPEISDAEQPSSWGELVFGRPAYAPPVAVGEVMTTTIRNGLDGAAVRDGMVGGSTICGGGMDPWTEWGNASYTDLPYFNVQNQVDVADFPCFSKYYVSFPLDRIPRGKVILAATLQLHQFGNAGAGWDPGPAPSYLQVLTVGEDWGPTLTWNNAPLPQENIAGAWVDPFGEPVPSEGADRQWSVSAAVAAAYGAGEPVRLAVYSADGDYHSGRYFRPSSFWDAEERPTLFVRWGEPGAKLFRGLLPFVIR